MLNFLCGFFLYHNGQSLYDTQLSSTSHLFLVISLTSPQCFSFFSLSLSLSFSSFFLFFFHEEKFLFPMSRRVVRLYSSVSLKDRRVPAGRWRSLGRFSSRFLSSRTRRRGRQSTTTPRAS